MAKDIPRNHHYVPRLLLANFADSAGRLWIYDLSLGTYRPGKPTSAAFERDLYAITKNGGERDFASVEKALAQQIESPAAKSIAKLLKRKQTSWDEWNNFLGFVAAQLVRTPAYLDRLEAMQAPVMQEMLERMAKFDVTFRGHLRKSMTRAGATAEGVEEQLQAAGNGHYRVRLRRDWLMAHALRMVELLHIELKEMHWTFLAVPAGESDLIIGDNPVMLRALGRDEKDPMPLGIRNRNLELVIPLASRMVAVARWSGPDSFGELANGFADVINEESFRCARRFVFASIGSEDLLARGKEHHGTGPKIRVRRVQAGEKLMLVSEFR